MHRKIHPEVFHKSVVLEKTIKFTGKHLQWSPFFNKVKDLQVTKIELPHWFFHVIFLMFSRPVILKECFQTNASRFIRLLRNFSKNSFPEHLVSITESMEILLH